jgi:hypothetical protein
MFSCLPAKLPDLAIVPAKYEVEVRDGFSSTDSASKRFSKGLLDAGRLSDAKSVRPLKSLAESISSADYMTKTLAMHLELWERPRINDFMRKGKGVKVLDALSSSDWVSKSNVITCVDTFLGEFYIGKRRGVNILEVLKTSEAVVKDAIKIVYDSGYLGDLAIKRALKVLRDEQVLGEYLNKRETKPLMEKFGLSEIVAKVGYTLTGEEVPRVYFLPDQYKYLWDVIEEEYHNTKVNACKRLYNVLQWIRRRVLGLKYPGAMRDAIGISDYVAKRVTIARREKLEYDFSLEKSK